MAPAAQSEAIGSRRHATDRRDLRKAVPEGYMKSRTWPKTAALVGLSVHLPPILSPPHMDTLLSYLPTS